MPNLLVTTWDVVDAVTQEVYHANVWSPQRAEKLAEKLCKKGISAVAIKQVPYNPSTVVSS